MFKSLRAHFKRSERVVDNLLKSKIKSLDEFRFFFDGESKIEPWISKLNLGDDKNIQAARLRRAWASESVHAPSTGGTGSSLSSILSETELRDAKILRTSYDDSRRQRSMLLTPRFPKCHGRWRSACHNALCVQLVEGQEPTVSAALRTEETETWGWSLHG